MNREILFRGKHIHVSPQNEYLEGTWVYGYLCDENYINSPELEGETLIDKLTICQYTGLTDKNDRKIFEKDFVRAPFIGGFRKKYMRTGIVEFRKGAFCVTWNDTKDTERHFVGYVKDIEVIGNLFDDPRLLE